MNIENYLFDTKWNKLIKPLEKYLLELAKKNPIYKNFNVNLPWISILWVHETILISEKFWFIQRLVEKDMIDFDKCWRCYEINSTYDHYNLEDKQDLWLIMLLSVSHKPIENLVSYLK